MADSIQPSSTMPPAAPLPSVDDLRSQASSAAESARASLNALAAEARDKVNEVVGSQKTAGADHLSGLAHAAQTAAGDLEGKSPAVAQLVRDAASSVDRFAGDLRNSDVRDIVQSVSGFARQQPVAFFAGSVLVGFALARFFKSEAAPGTARTPYRASNETGGYRDWSTTHHDDGSV